jgi:adenine-specific DNA-methyltransferase
VIKPYCRGKDSKKWCVDYQDLYLIFIRKGIRIKEYPAILKHLLQYEEKLRLRVLGNSEWYEFQCNTSYWEEFEKPKILLGRFMNAAKFSFDDKGLFNNDALYMVSGASKYLVGILNSQMCWWFLSQICTDLQNGYLQAYMKNLEQIPIPTATEAEQKAIEILVQKCLEAKGQNVSQWEQEIDERVARLYGLSDEEMEIIRGNTD